MLVPKILGTRIKPLGIQKRLFFLTIFPFLAIRFSCLETGIGSLHA